MTSLPESWSTCRTSRCTTGATLDPSGRGRSLGAPQYIVFSPLLCEREEQRGRVTTSSPPRVKHRISTTKTPTLTNPLQRVNKKSEENHTTCLFPRTSGVGGFAKSKKTRSPTTPESALGSRLVNSHFSTGGPSDLRPPEPADTSLWTSHVQRSPYPPPPSQGLVILPSYSILNKYKTTFEQKVREHVAKFSLPKINNTK